MSVQFTELFEDDSHERSDWLTLLWRRFGPEGVRQRAAERERALDDKLRIREIKWSWREACEGNGLGQQIFTPSGAAMAVPTIGRVTLGPPTTFTVRLRPGQLCRDLVAAAPRLAEAMGVAGISIVDLVPRWVVIELL